VGVAAIKKLFAIESHEALGVVWHEAITKNCVMLLCGGGTGRVKCTASAPSLGMYTVELSRGDRIAN
jgi:hypothetical protein